MIAVDVVDKIIVLGLYTCAAARFLSSASHSCTSHMALGRLLLYELRFIESKLAASVSGEALTRTHW